jgi:hypothetical protein
MVLKYITTQCCKCRYSIEPRQNSGFTPWRCTHEDKLVQVCVRDGERQMLRLEPAPCDHANPHGACATYRPKHFLRARMMLRLFWEGLWSR